VSRTPFLSLIGRGFTGKVYAALRMGRHGNRVAAAEVPRERSSLVGPRAFVWSRSNETCHHLGPGAGQSSASGGRSNLDGPEGPSVSNEGARFFTTRNYAPRNSRHWLPGERRRLVGPKAFDLNEVTRRITTRKAAPRIRGEFIFVCRGAL